MLPVSYFISSLVFRGFEFYSPLRPRSWFYWFVFIFFCFIYDYLSHLFTFSFVWDRTIICSSEWPKSLYVGQIGLELTATLLLPESLDYKHECLLSTPSDLCYFSFYYTCLVQYACFHNPFLLFKVRQEVPAFYILQYGCTLISVGTSFLAALQTTDRSYLVLMEVELKLPIGSVSGSHVL